MLPKQKSLNFGHYVPNDKVLNKKVPENPKYKHVKPAIYTGKNVRRHIDEIKEKQKNCVHKKEEVFKRIKVTAFIKLALACAVELTSSENIDNHSSGPSMPDKGDTDMSAGKCRPNPLMGIGELDLVNSRKKSHPASRKPEKLVPYLLLDVRDRDAFSRCHIKTAKHYPSTMLSRSIGYEIEDMKFYKNCGGAIIIVYDDDETTAARVATTLVERGYENVFLLTGGLNLALQICPNSLTTSSLALSPVHMLTHEAAFNASKSTTKEYFSQADIAAIQHNVDTYPVRVSNLVPSTSSSRSRSKSAARSFRNSLESAVAPSHASTSSQSKFSSSSSLTQQGCLKSVSTKSSRQSQVNSNSIKSVGLIHSKPADCKAKTKSAKTPWR